MFGLSTGEVLIVAFVIFLLFGPKGFQDILRHFIQIIKTLRKEIDDVKKEVNLLDEEKKSTPS